MADIHSHPYDQCKRLVDVINALSELRRSHPTPDNLARQATLRAERDELQGRGVPVLSSAELARAKAARPSPEPIAPRRRRRG